jgi:hypothetical protein
LLAVFDYKVRAIHWKLALKVLLQELAVFEGINANPGRDPWESIDYASCPGVEEEKPDLDICLALSRRYLVRRVGWKLVCDLGLGSSGVVHEVVIHLAYTTVMDLTGDIKTGVLHRFGKFFVLLTYFYKNKLDIKTYLSRRPDT